MILEEIKFTIKSHPEHGFIVQTDKNPYIMVGRKNRNEVIIQAFTKYLERRMDPASADTFPVDEQATNIVDIKSHDVV